MDAGYVTDPIKFLIQVVFGICTLIVLLRFLLQLVHADFYNPLSQAIVKATTPVLRPLRRFVPGIGGIDVSSLLLAWMLKTLELALIYLVSGLGFLLLPSIFLAIPELIILTIDIFLFGILILVILSWVNPGGHNPAASLLHDLTGPLLAPVRRRMPDTGPLDLSPLVVMVGLYMLRMFLIRLFDDVARQIAG